MALHYDVGNIEQIKRYINASDTIVEDYGYNANNDLTSKWTYPGLVKSRKVHSIDRCYASSIIEKNKK